MAPKLEVEPTAVGRYELAHEPVGIPFKLALPVNAVLFNMAASLVGILRGVTWSFDAEGL